MSRPFNGSSSEVRRTHFGLPIPCSNRVRSLQHKTGKLSVKATKDDSSSLLHALPGLEGESYNFSKQFQNIDYFFPFKERQEPGWEGRDNNVSLRWWTEMCKHMTEGDPCYLPVSSVVACPCASGLPTRFIPLAIFIYPLRCSGQGFSPCRQGHCGSCLNSTCHQEQWSEAKG